MTKDSAKLLRVTDSSCTAETPVREHDVFVRGVLTRTVFKLGEELLLPFEHGIKFMLDGFKVEEADGRTLDLPAVTKEHIRAELAPDQVIANLSELTLASLKLRAGQKKGGEIFLDAGDDVRNDIIDFLLNKAPATASEEPVETVDGEDDLVEHDDEGDGLVETRVPTPAGPVTSPFTDDKNPAAPAPLTPPPAVEAVEDTVEEESVETVGSYETK